MDNQERDDSPGPGEHWNYRLPKVYRSLSAPWGAHLDSLMSSLDGALQHTDDGGLPTGGQRGDSVPLRTRLGLTPFSIIEEEPEPRIPHSCSTNSLAGYGDSYGGGGIGEGVGGCSPEHGGGYRSLESSLRKEESGCGLGAEAIDFAGRRSPEGFGSDLLVSPHMQLDLSRSYDSAKVSALMRTTGRMQPPQSGTEPCFNGSASDSRLGDKRWGRVPYDAWGMLGALQAKFETAKEKVNSELRAFAEDVSLRLNSSGSNPTSGTPPRTPPRTPPFRNASQVEWKEGEMDKVEPPTDNSSWIEGARQLQNLASRCAEMSPEEFGAVCETIVSDLNHTRAQLLSGILKQLHTRMLFILTRCTRILQFQKESAMREESPFHRFFHPRPLDSPGLDRTWAPPPSPARDFEPRTRSTPGQIPVPPSPAPWRLRDPEAGILGPPSDWRARDTQASLLAASFDTLKAESLETHVETPRAKDSVERLDFGAGAGQAALLANKLTLWKKSTSAAPLRKCASSRLAGKGTEDSLDVVIEEGEVQDRVRGRGKVGSSGLSRISKEYFLPSEDVIAVSVTEEDRAKEVAEARAVDLWDKDDDSQHSVVSLVRSRSGKPHMEAEEEALEQAEEGENDEKHDDGIMPTSGLPERELSTGRKFHLRWGYWGQEEDEGECDDEETYTIRCRICEREVPANQLSEHSSLCAMAEECDTPTFSADQRLKRLAQTLDKLAAIEAARLGVTHKSHGREAGDRVVGLSGPMGSKGNKGSSKPGSPLSKGNGSSSPVAQGPGSGGFGKFNCTTLLGEGWVGNSVENLDSMARTKSGSSDQWATLGIGSQPSPIAGLVVGMRDFPDHYIGDDAQDKDDMIVKGHVSSVPSSATSSPANMISGQSSAVMSSASSDVASGEEGSPRATGSLSVLQGGSIGPGSVFGTEGGLQEVAADEDLCEIADMDYLVDLANDVANFLPTDEFAESFLNSYLQDLTDMLQDIDHLFPSIDTFGHRIKLITEEKLHQIRAILDGGSVDAFSDDGEDDDDGLMSRSGRNTPLHPAAQGSRHISIDDFDIIKPISKGAYGRVFLAKKKTTGDLFAMKVLRKADMIRKNAVESVQAERNILVTAQSPFVVRFFYSFTCRENLYLVMEYLNGGDLFSLLRNMGSLEEDDARHYIAELVLALEYLHSLGIVHRDLKPDNLLIAHDGHIKLTDFGLSKVGLINSTGEFSGQTAPSEPSSPGNFSNLPGSGQASPVWSNSKVAPANSFRHCSNGSSSPQWSSKSGNASPQWHSEEVRENSSKRGAVGTPDYLAPEILLGTAHGSTADWWSVGVMLFEFLTGVPPFNASSPETIFDNILNRDIPWPEVPKEMSYEARDLIDRLLASDPTQRLGYRGAGEVKAHPFFRNIRWDTLAREKAAFIPMPDDPLDTSYFMSRPGWNPAHAEREDSDCESASSGSTSTTQFAHRETGDETQDLIGFDRDTHLDKMAFPDFNFKNPTQLAAINYDLLERSGRDSPSRDFYHSPGRDFGYASYPSPARSLPTSPGPDY